MFLNAIGRRRRDRAAIGVGEVVGRYTGEEQEPGKGGGVLVIVRPGEYVVVGVVHRPVRD